MFEVAIALALNVVGVSLVLLLWRLFLSIGNSATQENPIKYKSGDRARHSDLALVSVGLMGFLVFPLILVGVRWSSASESITHAGMMTIMGFLLMGGIVYIYFVRTLGGTR